MEPTPAHSPQPFFPRLDPLLAIVLMFALTQVLGLGAGILLIEGAKVTPEVQYLSVAPTGSADDPLNAVAFMAYILLGAAGALLVIRFIKTRWAFRFLELGVVSGSVSVLLFAYLQGLAHVDFYTALGLSSLLGFAFAVAKFFWGRLKNAAAVMSSAGVGAIFGFSVGFWPALLFVLALSLYDYIAVFKTRHMLTLAQSLGDRHMSFTITADAAPGPDAPGGLAGGRGPEADAQAAGGPRGGMGFRGESGEGAPPARGAAGRMPPAPAARTHRAEHDIERLDLGSGDLAIPAMLAVAAYQVAGWPGALAVAAGSTLSIYHLLRFVIEKRVALPALPPICMGGLAALLLVKLAGF